MNESVFQQLTERNVLRTGNCITDSYFSTCKFFVWWMRRHLSIHCLNLANQAIPINSGLSMSHCTRKVGASHPICCIYWALQFSQLFQMQWHRSSEQNSEPTFLLHGFVFQKARYCYYWYFLLETSVVQFSFTWNLSDISLTLKFRNAPMFEVDLKRCLTWCVGMCRPVVYIAARFHVPSFITNSWQKYLYVMSCFRLPYL